MNALQTVAVVAEGAEPSKTAFYLAGGALALWAVLLSAVGLARPGFPAGVAQFRATIAVSAVLVVACVAAVLLTN